MTAVSDIFDPAFLEALAQLHVVARRRVPARGRPAEQRSRDLGGGIEFHDFRPYAPGDDFKAIDWNIYRRHGRVVIRLFEELEDLPLYLLPDVSLSTFLDRSGADAAPSRAVAGLRAALGLASIALNQMDRVGVFPFSNDLGPSLRPGAGHHRVLQVAAHLAALEPAGATDFERSMARFGALGLRRGLAVVISDFFDPAGVPAITAALSRLRHRLLLVQLVRASDADPEISGDVRVVDCETGSAEDLSVGDGALRRYRTAYAAFRAGLEDFARRTHAGLLHLDVERPVLPQLAALFQAGRYVA
jgi:uncharacterized protein (DUF58 family)